MVNDIPKELVDKFAAIKREYDQYTSPFQWHDAKWYFFYGNFRAWSI